MLYLDWNYINLYQLHKLTLYFFDNIEQMINYLCRTVFHKGYYDLAFQEKINLIHFIKVHKDGDNLTYAPTCFFLDYSLTLIVNTLCNNEIKELSSDEYIKALDEITHFVDENMRVSRKVLDDVRYGSMSQLASNIQTE